VRRAAVDGVSGYRNGYGESRRVALSCGTVRVRRPRVRGVQGLEERFESRVLPLFKRRTEEVGALLPELYLHGLSQGDFELALRGLLGDGAPLSASSIGRLKAKWQGEYQAWTQDSLEDRELVYVWADGVYVKAGLEKEKAALLVVIGALADGTKEVLAVVPGYRESKESWRAVFKRLGRGGGDLAGGPRAALLEPQARQRARPAAGEAAGDGARAVVRDPLCGDPARGGTAP
jgi:transposase-like protein